MTVREVWEDGVLVSSEEIISDTDDDLPVDLLLDATDPRDTSRIRRSEP